jgi:hypothetical protein
MTVPRIVQALATRIGIPSVEPRNTLVDWCQMPNAEWRVRPEDAEYANSCGAWGGQVCVRGSLGSSTVVFSNEEEETPFQVWDLHGKAISFRVDQPAGYFGFSFKQVLVDIALSEDPAFFSNGVEIATWADPEGNPALPYFGIYSNGSGTFSSAFDPVAPPWYRVIFHPDGETITCQISNDCGFWTTMLSSTTSAPLGFRRAFVRIIIANVAASVIPDTICMSQIYVEDFDPCMIEEES